MSYLGGWNAKRGLLPIALVCPPAAGFMFFTPSVNGGVIEHAPDRILLKLKADVPETTAQPLIAYLGASQIGSVPQIGVRILKIAPANLSAALDGLSHNPNVQFAEPDEIIAPDLIPDDPYFASQWHLPKIAAPAAWDTTAGSASVIVAILDTGVDGTHPDLIANLVRGWNIYDNNSNQLQYR